MVTNTWIVDEIHGILWKSRDNRDGCSPNRNPAKMVTFWSRPNTAKISQYPTFLSPKQLSFWQHFYKILWCLTHRFQCKNMFPPKIFKNCVTKQTDFLLQNVNIFWPTFVLKSWKIDLQTNFFQWILFEEMMI